MTPQDITPREALTRLGASTAEAIAQVLETFAPGAVERGEVSVIEEGAKPFANIPRGAVAASVSYIDGVTGANVFVMTPAGARKLATAMGVPPSEDEDGVELSELELSAIAESANQMMAAAAAAIGVLLGQEIQISPPDTRVLGSPAAAAEIYGTAPHATSTTFMIAGEACRLIQLVPSAFVVRMARAIDDLGSELSGADRGPGGSRAGIPAGSVALADALEQINMRVWVELGRTRMPLGQALALPLGAVVDLDSAAEAPVNLYVNGMRFAEGHLVVTDDGEWAVCVDKLGGRPRPPAGLEPPARPQLVTPADDVVEEVLEAPVAEEAPEAEEAPVAEEAPEEVVEEPSEEPEAHQSSPSLDPETPESADPDPQESSAPEAPEPPNPNSEGEVT